MHVREKSTHTHEKFAKIREVPHGVTRTGKLPYSHHVKFVNDCLRRQPTALGPEFILGTWINMVRDDYESQLLYGDVILLSILKHCIM